MTFRPNPPLEAVIGRVLLLAPSSGLGGGIERYVRGMESALNLRKVNYQRLDLRPAGKGSLTLRRKISFAFRVAAAVRDAGQPVRLVVAHPAMLPVTLLARFFSSYKGTIVIYYGSEVWRSRKIPGRHLARRADTRVIAISSFTSGALQPLVSSTVVNPAPDEAWYSTLIAAAEVPEEPTKSGPFRLLTVFRLQDWESKGLGIIVNAIELLEHDVRLVVIGSGSSSPELDELVRSRPWVQLKVSLDDQALAAEYAAADLVVLATRTRNGEDASGEGFGLCLIEAQLAGTAVVAPAFGGSHDTFLQGITGLAPVDESPEALAGALNTMIMKPEMRAGMARAGAEWSRQAFDPSRMADVLVDALLMPIRRRRQTIVEEPHAIPSESAQHGCFRPSRDGS